MFASLNKKTYTLAVIGTIVLAAIIILTDNNAPAPNTSLPSFLKENVIGAKPEQPASLTHPDSSFSFLYPDDFSIRTQDDGEGGETITIEHEGIGMQVAFTPFDENIALTGERIKQDIPELIMNNIEVVTVGGTQAVAFTSTNASTETSNEIWFVYTGRLYQTSAPKGSEKLMSDIITTWRWK